jgi:hypothetical protein
MYRTNWVVGVLARGAGEYGPPGLDFNKLKIECEQDARFAA